MRGCSIVCIVTQLVFIAPVGESITPMGIQILPTVVRTPPLPITPALHWGDYHLKNSLMHNNLM